MTLPDRLGSQNAEREKFIEGWDAGQVLADVETIDPAATARIASDPQLAPVAPSIAGSTGNPNATLGILTSLGLQSYGVTAPEQTTVVAQFYDTHAAGLDTDTRRGLDVAFIRVDPRDQENLAAQAMLYLADNPLDLNSAEGQRTFLDFMLRRANHLGRTRLSGFHGIVLDWLDKPYNFVSQQISNMAASGALGGVMNAFPGAGLAAAVSRSILSPGMVDGSGAAIRRSLSPGQNIALEFGITPADAGWSIGSGMVDAALRVTVDPLDLAIPGVAKGVRLARMFPAAASGFKGGWQAYRNIPDAPTGLSRLRPQNLLQQTAYAGWSRTADQIADGLKKQEYFNQIAEAETFNDVRRLLPDVEDDLVDLFTRPQMADPANVEDFFRLGMKMQLDEIVPRLQDIKAEELGDSVAAADSRIGNVVREIGNLRAHAADEADLYYRMPDVEDAYLPYSRLGDGEMLAPSERLYSISPTDDFESVAGEESDVLAAMLGQEALTRYGELRRIPGSEYITRAVRGLPDEEVAQWLDLVDDFDTTTLHDFMGQWSDSVREMAQNRLVSAIETDVAAGGRLANRWADELQEEGVRGVPVSGDVREFFKKELFDPLAEEINRKGIAAAFDHPAYGDIIRRVTAEGQVMELPGGAVYSPGLDERAARLSNLETEKARYITEDFVGADSIVHPVWYRQDESGMLVPSELVDDGTVVWSLWDGARGVRASKVMTGQQQHAFRTSKEGRDAFLLNNDNPHFDYVEFDDGVVWVRPNELRHGSDITVRAEDFTKETKQAAIAEELVKMTDEGPPSAWMRELLEREGQRIIRSVDWTSAVARYKRMIDAQRNRMASVWAEHGTPVISEAEGKWVNDHLHQRVVKIVKDLVKDLSKLAATSPASKVPSPVVPRTTAGKLQEIRKAARLDALDNALNKRIDPESAAAIIGDTKHRLWRAMTNQIEKLGDELGATYSDVIDEVYDLLPAPGVAESVDTKTALVLVEENMGRLEQALVDAIDHPAYGREPTFLANAWRRVDQVDSLLRRLDEKQYAFRIEQKGKVERLLDENPRQKLEDELEGLEDKFLETQRDAMASIYNKDENGLNLVDRRVNEWHAAIVPDDGPPAGYYMTAEKSAEFEAKRVVLAAKIDEAVAADNMILANELVDDYEKLAKGYNFQPYGAEWLYRGADNKRALETWHMVTTAKRWSPDAKYAKTYTDAHTAEETAEFGTRKQFEYDPALAAEQKAAQARGEFDPSVMHGKLTYGEYYGADIPDPDPSEKGRFMARFWLDPEDYPNIFENVSSAEVHFPNGPPVAAPGFEIIDLATDAGQARYTAWSGDVSEEMKNQIARQVRDETLAPVKLIEEELEALRKQIDETPEGTYRQQLTPEDQRWWARQYALLQESGVLNRRDQMYVRRDAAKGERLRLDVEMANAAVFPERYAIVDIPHKVRWRWPKGFKPSESDWASSWRRNVGALLKPQAPTGINVSNLSDGASTLRMLGNSLGYSPEKTDSFVQAFRKGVDQSERELVVREMMLAGSDNPLYELLIGNFFERFSRHDSMLDPTGKAVNIGLDGERKAVMTGHDAGMIPLPNIDEVKHTINRLHSARRLPKNLLEGWLPKTKGQRTGLAAKYKKLVREHYGEEYAEGFSDDDFLQLAYATVFESDEGRGTLWKARHFALQKPYRWSTNTFSVNQLWMRPGAWMTRVILDEHARAAMLGMSSMFTKPAGFLKLVRDAQELRGKGLRQFHEAANTMIDEVVGVGLDPVARADELGIKIDWSKVGASQLERRAALAEEAYHLVLADRSMLRQVGLDSWMARRRLRKGAQVRKQYNLSLDWNPVDDASELINTTIANEFTGDVNAMAYRTMKWNPKGMQKDDYETFGRNWGTLLYKYIESDDTQVALRYLADGGYTLDDAVYDYMHTRQWHMWNQNIVSVLSANPRFSSQFSRVEEAARIWVEKGLVPQVQQMIGPFKYDPVRRVLSSTPAVGEEAFEVTYTPQSLRSFADSISDYVIRHAKSGEQELFPANLPTFYDARYHHQELRQDGKSNITNWVMDMFGERATQALARQPTYLRYRKEWMDRLNKMGFSDEVAEPIAHARAATRTGHIFFNNRNILKGFRMMNRVSPFFSAMGEVAWTWFYKIPMELGGPVLGHAAMVRKMDRIMDAGHHLGLVETDDGDVRTTRMRVNPLAWKRIFEIRQGLSEGMGTEDEPSDWTVPLGTPIDWTTRGILALGALGTQLYPWVSAPLARWMNGWDRILDDRAVDTVQGETIADLIARTEPANIGKFYDWNRDRLIEAIGERGYEQILTGDRSVELPGDLTLTIPESNLWGQLIDGAFFSWGREELSPLGFGLAFFPQNIQSLLRGISLWTDTGMLSHDRSSKYRMQIGTLDQIVLLEAGEGLITRSLDAVRRLGEAQARMLDDPSDENYAAANQAKRDLEAADDELVSRAEGTAGSKELMRLLTGIALPATPGDFGPEDRMRNWYYAANDQAKGYGLRYKDGKGSFTPVKVESVEDVERIVELAEKWFNDPRGGSAKAFIRERYPTMFSAVVPRTHYTGIGVPNEGGDLNAYFQAVGSGDRSAYVQNAWIGLVEEQMVRTDFELELQETWGHNPGVQAQGAIADWGIYKDMLERQQEELDYVALADELVRNSALQTLKTDKRGRTIFASVVDDLYAEIDVMDQIIDDLEKNEYNTEEQVAALSETKAARRARRDRLTELMGDSRNLAYRDRMIAQYFLEVESPHWEQMTDLTERAETATSSEERDLLYREKRAADNARYRTPVVIGGLTFVSPQERAWSALDDRQREKRVRKGLTNPQQWNTQFMAEQIVEMYPDALGRIPVTEEQFAVYEKYDAMRIEVNARRREILDDPVPSDNRYFRLKSGEASKMLEQIDELEAAELRELGREDEVEFREAWPMKRLHLVGALPSVLTQHYEQGELIWQTAAAQDLGMSSDAVEAALGNLMDQIIASSDQQVLEAYAQLGSDLLGVGTDTPGRYVILPVLQYLFQGTRFGRLR